MPNGLHIFGLVHLAILGMVLAAPAILAAVQRKFPRADKAIRVGLAILLFASTASYYGSFAVHGVRMFPEHMPLQLCDASLWLAIVSLLTLRPAIFDVTYYLALAGASMSLLTPNLVNPTPFLAVQFFADHGLIVAATLYLVWSGQARPRPGSVVRAMLALNILAAIAGSFDFFFNTDYMFLRVKPPTVSLLDAMGPWPWYIVSCEAVGVGLFLLLYLPFRQGGSEAVGPTLAQPHKRDAPFMASAPAGDMGGNPLPSSRHTQKFLPPNLQIISPQSRTMESRSETRNAPSPRLTPDP